MMRLDISDGSRLPPYKYVSTALLDKLRKSRHGKHLAWQTVLGPSSLFHHRQRLVESGGYEEGIFAMG